MMYKHLKTDITPTKKSRQKNAEHCTFVKKWHKHELMRDTYRRRGEVNTMNDRSRKPQHPLIFETDYVCQTVTEYPNLNPLDIRWLPWGFTACKARSETEMTASCRCDIMSTVPLILPPMADRSQLSVCAQGRVRMRLSRRRATLIAPSWMNETQPTKLPLAMSISAFSHTGPRPADRHTVPTPHRTLMATPAPPADGCCHRTQLPDKDSNQLPGNMERPLYSKDWQAPTPCNSKQTVSLPKLS